MPGNVTSLAPGIAFALPLPEPHTPRRLVTAVLMEMVPRPEDRRHEAETAAIFMRRHQLRPESLAQLGAGKPSLPAMIADQIRLAGVAADPELAAGGLIALLDGLILAVVTGQQTSTAARAIMAAQLDYVFS